MTDGVTRLVSVSMKHAGLSFYSRRMLQRWERGEIDTAQLLTVLRKYDGAQMICIWKAPD
jgi:hypothetical protein